MPAEAGLSIQFLWLWIADEFLGRFGKDCTVSLSVMCTLEPQLIKARGFVRMTGKLFGWCTSVGMG